MKRTLYTLTVVLIVMSIALPAQKVMDGRDWHEWTEKDCKKMLDDDSGWNRKYEMAAPATQLPASKGGVNATNNNDTNSATKEVTLTYNIRIISAQPLRMANVRRVQFSPEFKNMNEEQRKNALAQMEDYVAKDYGDSIVVWVSFKSSDPGLLRSASAYWKNRTVESLKETTFLTNGKDKIQPVDFHRNPADPSNIEFVFPRTVNGKPLVDKDNKSAIFEFKAPSIDNLRDADTRGAKPGVSTVQAGQKISAEFKTEKMMVDGKLVY